MRGEVAAFVMTAALFSGAATGCGGPPVPASDAAAEPPSAPLVVSWRLADARSCEEAALSTVRVRLSRDDGFATSVTYRCDTGLELGVGAPQVPAGFYRVTVDGRSGAGTVMYRSVTLLELSESEALDVVLLPTTLRFTGGGGT